MGGWDLRPEQAGLSWGGVTRLHAGGTPCGGVCPAGNQPGRAGRGPAPPQPPPPSQGRPAELFHCHDWLLSEGVIIFTS